jgi:hypothetical protein
MNRSSSAKSGNIYCSLLEQVFHFKSMVQKYNFGHTGSINIQTFGLQNLRKSLIILWKFNHSGLCFFFTISHYISFCYYGIPLDLMYLVLRSTFTAHVSCYYGIPLDLTEFLHISCILLLRNFFRSSVSCYYGIPLNLV